MQPSIAQKEDVYGELEITFSNGLKLIQPSGFSPDGKRKIFLINDNNEKIEMTPEVTLQVVE